MVAMDASSGTPVRVSGAALAGGSMMTLAPGRRLNDVARVSATVGNAFPALFRRAAGVVGSGPAQLTALEPSELLPVRWGIPSFFGGASFGPPYELDNRTAEWQLSAGASSEYFALDRQARMAHRVHPRGPQIQTAGALLAALYGTSPTPRFLGVGLDATQ